MRKSENGTGGGVLIFPVEKFPIPLLTDQVQAVILCLPVLPPFPQPGRTDLSQEAYEYCDGDPVNAVDPSGHDSLNLGGLVPPVCYGPHYPQKWAASMELPYSLLLIHLSTRAVNRSHSLASLARSADIQSNSGLYMVTQPNSPPVG